MFSGNITYKYYIISVEERNELLLQALCDVLVLVSSGQFSVLSLEEESSNNQSESSNEPGGSKNNEEEEPENKTDQSDTGESCRKKSRMDQELYHSNLR